MRTKEEWKFELPKANIENEIFSDVNSSIVWLFGNLAKK